MLKRFKDVAPWGARDAWGGGMGSNGTNLCGSYEGLKRMPKIWLGKLGWDVCGIVI